LHVLCFSPYLLCMFLVFLLYRLCSTLNSYALFRCLFIFALVYPFFFIFLILLVIYFFLFFISSFWYPFYFFLSSVHSYQMSSGRLCIRDQ
jgi:hypothetical protein